MHTRPLFFAFIITIMLPVCFNTWGLTESSEARYAEISREMYLGGDYIHPELLGIDHYHKPPVTYYITALGYAVFGVNEYGVRFFPALALLLQLLLVFKIGHILFNDRKTATIAALFYFSYPLVHAAARNLTTDCFLTTFIFAAIYFYLQHRQAAKGYLHLYLFYLFCGLCFLTKGPVGVLPPAVFAIVGNRFIKTGNKFSLHHIAALLMGILICISWFIVLLIDNHNPALLDYFVNHQLVDRVASDSFGRSQQFWYYLVFLPLAGFPTIIIFVDYLITGLRKDWVNRAVNLIPAIVFLICFIVFSASSSKLIFYVLPLYLLIAILSSRHLLAMSLRKQLLYCNLFFYCSVLLLAALLFAAFFVNNLYIPRVPIGIGCAAGIGLLIFCRYQPKIPTHTSLVLVPSACLALLTFILPVVLKKNEAAINSMKPVAAFINSRSVPGSANIIVYDQLLPSLEFYTGSKLVTIHHVNSRSKRETEFEPLSAAGEKRYFEVEADMQTNNFRNLQNLPHCFVVAKASQLLPDSLAFLTNKLLNKTVMGKWVVYY